MIVFDKVEIKDSLSSENIFELLVDFGGDPEYSSFGILCSTICHNPPGEGSRKLYFYDNSHLFRCYTGCDSYFDIFELVIKVAKIQWDKDYDLNDVLLIAKKGQTQKIVLNILENGGQTNALTINITDSMFVELI